MKRVILRCGCGAMVEKRDIDDGKDKFTKVEYAGECAECYANGGDYMKGERWKEK